MNFLYPEFKLRSLPTMLRIGILGALLGGLYGAIHDQVTYSISHEYFTRMKFDQFRYADFGYPPRIFVAEIGFLATWWFGFFAAWFLARIAVPLWPAKLAIRRSLQGFLIMFLTAFATAGTGYLTSMLLSPSFADWSELCDHLGVTDTPAFVQVACIHYSSYLGGLVGLVLAILFLKRCKRIDQCASSDPSSSAPET